LPGRFVEATIDAATQGQKSRKRAPFASIDKKGAPAAHSRSGAQRVRQNNSAARSRFSLAACAIHSSVTGRQKK
jgi:hypothetical protein